MFFAHPDLCRDLCQCLPTQILHQMSGIHPLVETESSDRMVRKHTPTGKFSIASTIEFMSNPSSNLHTSQDSSLWKKIWSWNGPQKIRTFLWLVAKEKLLTNAQRYRRHLVDSDRCPRCDGQEETTAHMLRDCHVSMEIWQ